MGMHLHANQRPVFAHDTDGRYLATVTEDCVVYDLYADGAELLARFGDRIDQYGAVPAEFVRQLGDRGPARYRLALDLSKYL